MTKKCIFLFSALTGLFFTHFITESTTSSHQSKIIYLHEQKMRSIADSALNRMIQEGNVIIVFYEDWCGPCKRMKPIFEKLVHKINNILCIKVKRSLYKDFFDQFKLTTIPAMLFFKKGKLVHIHKQSATEEDMVTLIKKAFNI